MAGNKTGPRHQGRKGAWFHIRWIDAIVVLPDEERVLPVTIAHEEVAEHVFGCECIGCSAYPLPLLRKLKRARLSASAQR